MTHPYESHKNTHHDRAKKMTAGYAHGGHIGHKAETKPKAGHHAKKMPGEHKHEMHGGEAKPRADKFARGGRSKNAKTHVSVNVMPQGGPSPAPMLPHGAGMAPPMAPPRPPMAPPPGAMPGGPPMGGPPMGMPPGGMPPPGLGGLRKSGGRAFKRGGSVSDGPTFREGIRNATKVDHAGDRNLKDVGRGPVITKKAGGRIEGSSKDFSEHRGSIKMSGDRSGEGKSTGGGDFSEHRKMKTIANASGGGLGRLEKVKMERKSSR